MLRAVVLAAVAAATIAGCAAINSEANTYATIDEARAAGAVAHGWIPDGLPTGTSDLREGHEKGGAHWGLFAFPASGQDALHRLLGDEVTASVPPCDPPGRFEWWPRMLRTPIDLAKAHAAGLHLYAGRDDRTYAINWTQGRAYYWKQ